MAFTVTVHRGPACLLMEMSGEATLVELKASADLAAAICRDAHYRRALVDLLQVHQALSFTEHLQLGAHIAEKLGFLDRVATVVPQSDRTGTSEKAARKLGLHLRTFTQMEAAREWLAED